MATAAKLQAPADPIQQIMALLTGFGGENQTQTSNPGNIDPLMQVIAQLQGLDPQAQLATIFQQASGQIPGLQNAYANAVGARRSGNSGVQNALSQLLAQTTITGQQQVAQQQQQALQTQTQAAGAVANATKGTTTKTSSKPDIGNAAKNMMILQGLAKLSDTSIGKQLFSGMGITPGAQTTSAPVPMQASAPLQSAQAAPAMSMAPAAAPLDIMGMFAGGTGTDNVMPDMGGFGSGGVSYEGLSDYFADASNIMADSQQIDPMDALMLNTGGFGTMDTDAAADDFMNYLYMG